MHILSDGQEHCVCELMRKLDVSQSRMSRHMAVLRQAGLVVDRRDAQWVRYRIAPKLRADVTAVLNAALNLSGNGKREAA